MIILTIERKRFLHSLLWLTLMVSLTEGQQYNLTGSSEFASLAEAFTWTCGMFLPPGQIVVGVFFYRNNNQTALVGMQGTKCVTQSADPRYSYGCLTENVFSLTIPAENMTEFEQKSAWKCEYVFNVNYRSPNVILNIAIDVYNVSMIPSDNPLTIREGTQRVFRCVVNSNAVPAPIFTWYLGSTDITIIAVTETTSITLTGDRTDNTKTLQCRATNNNKPAKTTSTTLNVEYPPTINTLSLQDIIEGRDLSVTCQAIPGNPSSTTFYWNKVDNPGFRQNRSTLRLYNIQRNSSGTYICTTENSYNNGEKGTHSQSLVVNVQYPPSVNALSNQIVVEGRDLSISCQTIPGNPSSNTVYWTKVQNSGFRQNGTIFQIRSINRTSAGIYRCTAENIYSDGQKGTDSQSMLVNVLYPPMVNALSQQNIFEGRNLSVKCQFKPGNPNSTTFYWTKEDTPAFRQNGSTLQLHNIQRNHSGTYRCTAENIYSNGEKGAHSQTMGVNIQYSPTIENRSLQRVNESESVTLTRNIASNPLSNASWYNETQLLKTEFSVQTTTYTIENTKCTDTNNYTIVASNGIGNTATTMVELIVNCKPMPDYKSITIGVTCTTGIEFSTTVIAYPEPLFELQYENGSRNTQMMSYITRNAVNNFTAHFRQTFIDQRIFGLHYLRMSNVIGESTVIVNVIRKIKGKPDTPRNITVVCEITQARVEWISSFNGGDPQYFTVNTLNSQDGTILTYRVIDKGENKMHVTSVNNLQPSVMYWFYVSAKNSYGSSVSEVNSCKTVKEITSPKTGVVAGSVGGALVLVTIVLILWIVLHRRYTCICNIAIEKRNKRDTTDETNKDLSNYTTIKEQQEHTERNMYDELTSNETANQYEVVLTKDNDGNNEKLYEKLQKSVDKGNEGNSTNQSIPLKTQESTDDKFGTQNTEEYINTSFLK